MTEKLQIDSFREDFAFLSNFYTSPFSIGGKLYATNEHFFQASKAGTDFEHEKIRLAKTPSEAKKLGRQVSLRKDWESIKDQIMELGLRAKFADGNILAERLLATSGAELVEKNTWHDVYWGVCDGKGQNKLGKLLMKIRGELATSMSTQSFIDLDEE